MIPNCRYRSHLHYNVFTPLLLSLLLLFVSWRTVRAQDLPIFGLPHVSTTQPTDGFILQRVGDTRDHFIYNSELFAPYTLSPAYPTYDVTMAPYNAACNGSTDDTTAIQSAINDAGTAGWGAIKFPPGRCIYSHLVVNKPNVFLIGQGMGATILLSNATTGDGISFGNTAAPYIGCGGVKDLMLSVVSGKTSGSILTVDGCNIGVVKNVRFYTNSGGDGIYVSPTGGLSGFWFFDTIEMELNGGGTFTGIKILGSNDQFFKDIHIAGSSATSVGVEVKNNAGAYLDRVSAVLLGYGFLIDPGNGQSVMWGKFTDCIADTNGLDGWRIAPTGTGTVYGEKFIGSWSGNNTADGFYISGGVGTELAHSNFYANKKHGVELVGGTYTTLSGGDFIGNSTLAANTYDGIAIGASVSHALIDGVTSGSAGVGAFASQRYGISVAAGADNYIITSNKTCSNTTGAVLNTPGLASTRVVTNNSCATMDSYAPSTSKYIVQGTSDAALTAAQFLGALGTGIVKNTTTTGVLSIGVAGDFPTLNQSTTGSAATLTTPRAIYGNNFDGSAALAQIIASTYGGTGNGFTKFTGPATSEKTFTLPNASATVLTDNAAVTVAQGGTNLTSAADDNVIVGNGTTWQSKALTNCTDTVGQHINYDTSTNTFSCGTSVPTTVKGWNYSGSTISLGSSTDSVGIGTSSPTSKLTVSLNTANLPTPTTGTLVQVGNADATSTRVAIDSFGAGGLPSIDFRRALNTAASPNGITTASSLGGLNWFSHDGTAYSTAAATLSAQAAATWSISDHATNMLFGTTNSGATTSSTKLLLGFNGHMITAGGTAPTVACTGTGTSPTAPSMDTGSTDVAFTVIMPTGTGVPGSTGTCTVTFGSSYAGNTANKPVLICTLQDGASSWSNEAVVRVSTSSQSAPVLTWTNEATGVLTGLTVSSSYQINCIVVGK